MAINTDKPASPIPIQNHDGEVEYFGLSKREYACIQLMVPESGDPKIDDWIVKGRELGLNGAYVNEGFAYGHGALLNKKELVSTMLTALESGDDDIDSKIVAAKRQAYIKAALSGLLTMIDLSDPTEEIAALTTTAVTCAIDAADKLIAAE